MSVSILRTVQQYGRLIDPLIEEEFPEGAVPFLSEGARYQLTCGGKRLRPALCLLTCEGLGGRREEALPFACASEILHNLFLIHDDIEDGDRKRRNRDTLWVKFGLPNAINVGDFLTAKAYRILLRTPVAPEVLKTLVAIFTDTYLTTTQGQALDINLRASPEVTLGRYLQIVSLKTARYLAYNMVGGAVIAGAGNELQEKLWEVGRYLGPAFQIQDDLLDLSAGKGRGGAIGCDIREGKPTIFLAYILQRDPRTEVKEKLLEILRKPREETTDQEVSWAISFYRDAGALAFAREEAARLAQRAEELLQSLPLRNGETFAALCRFVVEREV